jgi:MoxR-like ATPase
MKKSLTLVVVFGLAALLIAGVYEVFRLRFQAGDIYPEYSTLRADPLGAKAAFDTIEELGEHLQVIRQRQDLRLLELDSNSTLFFAGVTGHWLDQVLTRTEFDVLDTAIREGTRCVITFSGRDNAIGGDIEREEEDEEAFVTPDDVLDREAGKSAQKTDEPEVEKDDEEGAVDPEEMPILGIGEIKRRWGFEAGYATGENWDLEAGVAAKVEIESSFLEEIIAIRSPWRFTRLAPAWKPIATVGGRPVIMERAYGEGVLVLCADSWFLSNESLAKRRALGELLWAVGDRSTIVFDETHHGVLESEGVVGMVARYRLHGVIRGCGWNRCGIGRCPPHANWNRKAGDPPPMLPRLGAKSGAEATLLEGGGGSGQGSNRCRGIEVIRRKKSSRCLYRNYIKTIQKVFLKSPCPCPAVPLSRASDQSLHKNQMNENVERINQVLKSARAEVGKVIIGQSDVVDQCLIAIFTGNHILLEGVPGVAKTLLVRTLAHVLGTDFARIQFTPDLMPADITGTNVFSLKDNAFTLVQGPVFTSFLLADEINRAPAKTQSALLQAMQERLVTIDRNTYALPASFTVFATQNPIEYEGTYPLPEAQKDRFLLKVDVSYPNQSEELELAKRSLGNESPERLLANGVVKPVIGDATIADMREALNAILVKEELIHYAVELVRTTRSSDSILVGAGPRATQALLLSSRAVAAIDGRDFVTPDDIRTMTRPVLSHRIVLRPEYEIEGMTVGESIEKLLEKVPVPR